MTPKEELQSLLQGVQSPEIKKVLSDYQAKLETEAPGVLARLEAQLAQAEDSIKADWVKFKALL